MFTLFTSDFIGMNEVKQATEKQKAYAKSLGATDVEVKQITEKEVTKITLALSDA